MASFPQSLFASLQSLSLTGQQLLVANNLKGITETERGVFKSLILKNDPRMVASIEAFQLDRDANALVNYWRSLDLEEEIEEEDQPSTRLTREAVVDLLDGVYRKLSPTGGAESRAAATRATADFFATINSRDGKATLEDLQIWLSTEPVRAAKKPAAQKLKTELVSRAVLMAPRDEAKAKKATPTPSPKPAAPAVIKVETRMVEPVRLEPQKHVQQVCEPPAEKTAPARTKKARQAPNHMARLLSLRDDAGLKNVSPVQIVDRIRALFRDRDDITETEFVGIMMDLGRKYTGAKRDQKEAALKEIFALMDVNKSATLDREELINALAAISGGSEEDKIDAVFMLYDLNGDGLISFDEMQRHQTAVFRVAFALDPKLQSKLGATPEALATATTEGLFREVDTDSNNVISLDEFKAWYSGETPSEEAKAARVQRTHALEVQKANAPAARTINTTANLEALKETIEGLGLKGVHVADAMSVFKEHGAGIFSRQQFKDTLRSVIQQYGNPSQIRDSDFNSVCADLFLTFDFDQSSTVDMQELFSGLSVLCEGTPGEKLRVAFDLYDESGDGYIQYQELVKYIGAVFRLVLARQGQTPVSVEELAQATARNCFEVNEQSVETGKLTFVQFKEWHDAIGVRI